MAEYEAALTHALEYHDYGLAPISLPYGEKWQRRHWRAYYDRQPTPTEIRAMFADGKDHNIGAMTGRASGNALCIDCDTLPTYEEWHRRLMGLGIDAWTVRREANGSDHDGGGHFWMRAPVAVQTKAFDGYEVRGQGHYAVVPRSLHPGGSIYISVWGHPARIPELDRLNAIPELVLYEAGPTIEPSRLAWRLLKGDADTLQRYNTRSHADCALCVSLYNTGHTYGDAMRLFTKHPTSGKFLQLWHKGDDRNPPSQENALRYLLLTWTSAQEWADSHTSAPVQLALELAAWANDRPWPGRTGATDHAVYLAHLAIVQRCGKVVYGASCRELAELAGTSHVTAGKATARLTDAHGLLYVVQESAATLSTRYALIEPDDLECAELNTHYTDPVRECKVTHNDALSRECVITHTARECPFKSSDAFRRSGLGKSGFEVYTALGDRGRLTVPELVEVTGRHRTTIRRKLALMEELNLATPFGDREWMLNAIGDLEHAAEILETAGQGERQRQRHIRQRALHRVELGE